MKNTLLFRVIATSVLVAGMALFNQDTKATMDFRELLALPKPKANRHILYGDQTDQFGELWLPDSDGIHPVLILIHGGCWLESLPGLDIMNYIAEDLRHYDIAVWNIEYRRLGTKDAGYPATFLDVAHAIDKLRDIATDNNLDLSHVVIAGHSAGGHLALWAAGRSGINRQSPLHANDPLPIKAVISLAGINDLADYRKNGPSSCVTPQLIDALIDTPHRTGEDVYADTSPAAMLPLHVPQVIISGDLDMIVPERFGINYTNAATAAGDKAESIVLQNTGHIEFISPKSEAWPQIRRIIKKSLIDNQ